MAGEVGATVGGAGWAEEEARLKADMAGGGAKGRSGGMARGPCEDCLRAIGEPNENGFRSSPALPTPAEP